MTNKIVRRYCKRCHKETLHDSRKSVTGIERALVTIFTAGLYEGLSDETYKCQECRRVSGNE